MKKLIYLGVGLALSLQVTLFTGCEKQKETEEPATDSGLPEAVKDLEASMVYADGCTFTMGATSEQGDDAYDWEKPVHDVTLDGFNIGAFEVTQGQWKAVMGTTVEQQRDKAAEAAGKDPSEWGLYGVGDSYPMYYVSWDEAQEFCTKLSAQTGKKYRLPTEAEWEYAARGGNKADGTKYAGSNNIDEVAWYNNSYGLGKDNPDYGTHPVGTKKSNNLGIYDMSGNVLEWCQDWYGPYSESSVVNPQGLVSGAFRVIRGGGWSYSARDCRVSSRSYTGEPGTRRSGLGFRVVCER